jgi:hypothetical protein
MSEETQALAELSRKVNYHAKLVAIEAALRRMAFLRRLPSTRLILACDPFCLWLTRWPRLGWQVIRKKDGSNPIGRLSVGWIAVSVSWF